RLGVPPARCVVVEDAPAGVEAAHRAGMTCVGVISTGRTHSDVAHAERVVRSLRELSPRDFAALLNGANVR
ncbi:MAG: HAD-IA family hydrolase, partial [Phycisphaerales bacterium]|nr:HAD-IA family hydrolase [Phycisphaerales bacterium]